MHSTIDYPAALELVIERMSRSARSNARRPLDLDIARQLTRLRCQWYLAEIWLLRRRLTQ